MPVMEEKENRGGGAINRKEALSVPRAVCVPFSPSINFCSEAE